MNMEYSATFTKIQLLLATRNRLNAELNNIFESLLKKLFKNEDDVVNENALLTKEISTLLYSYYSKLEEIGKSSNVKRKIYDDANYPIITVVNNIMELTLSANHVKESDIDNINQLWRMLHAYINNPDESFRDIPVTARIKLNMSDK